MLQKIKDYLSFNIATSKEIQKNTGISQISVSRTLRHMGNSIVKIPNGKSPKYALTTNAFGVDDSIPIWEVDNFGKHTCIAVLRPLAVGGYFVEQRVNMPYVFLGEKGNCLYDDLPYFLRDMAPKGFLGREIAKRFAELDNSFPNDLNSWSNAHIGRYLLANTENSVGSLKFGDNSNLRLHPSIDYISRKNYFRIAENIINSEEGLSSIGGERPKFTGFCQDINHHTIVKFSPKGDNENARRWRDVLITEYCANQIINQSGFLTAADSEIFEIEDRLFLESKRFDRPSKNGRNSMLSLTMIDAEFVGSGTSWLDSANGLYKKELISKQDLINIESLSIFAKLIHNTDTHLGNISFETHNNGFRLLPIYDMCSMGFAPKSNGEITDLRFVKPNVENINNVNLGHIKHMAFNFWNLVKNHELVSKEFKEFIVNYILPQYDDIQYQQSVF